MVGHLRLRLRERQNVWMKEIYINVFNNADNSTSQG